MFLKETLSKSIGTIKHELLQHFFFIWHKKSKSFNIAANYVLGCLQLHRGGKINVTGGLLNIKGVIFSIIITTIITQSTVVSI